jgi:hypothetical protein
MHLTSPDRDPDARALTFLSDHPHMELAPTAASRPDRLHVDAVAIIMTRGRIE